MKANELRKFNLVSTGGVICQVRSIGVYENIRLSPYPDNGWMESFDTSDVSPIPLTEEWLKRFGFRRVNSTWHKLGNLCINISHDVEWGGNWMGIRLKYVHQLQNLYFALTGEELHPL